MQLTLVSCGCMSLTMHVCASQEKSGYSSDEGGMGSTYRVPGPPPAPIFSSVAAAPAPSAADGSEEERLVESICSRGGLRAQPDREALRLFVESLANLSGGKVAQQLQHKIVSPLRPLSFFTSSCYCAAGSPVGSVRS